MAPSPPARRRLRNERRSAIARYALLVGVLLAGPSLACGHAATEPGISWAAVPLPEADASARERIVRYGPLVERTARRFGLDPALVAGLVWVESRFDPAARSRAGAVGLMQLMPRTARGIAARLGHPVRRRNPRSNLEAGCYYLRSMLDRFDGDVRWALAAYHAGPGNARRYRRRGRMSPATARYVRRVLEARRRFARAAGPRGLARGVRAPALGGLW